MTKKSNMSFFRIFLYFKCFFDLFLITNPTLYRFVNSFVILSLAV